MVSIESDEESFLTKAKVGGFMENEGETTPCPAHQMSVEEPLAPERQAAKTSHLAVGSLICGVLGFFTAGLASVVAIVIGHISFSKIRKSAGTQKGLGYAIAGLVLGYVPFVAGILVVCVLKNQAGVAKDYQSDIDAKSYQNALAVYKLNAGNYPSTGQGLKALVEKPTVVPFPKRWIQIITREYLDPWGNAYRYKFPSRESPEKPEISSNGPDGKSGTADDLIYQLD
ncbi:MAG: type II secretion system protein GspG [Luteolibacter sp.]